MELQYARTKCCRSLAWSINLKSQFILALTFSLPFIFFPFILIAIHTQKRITARKMFFLQVFLSSHRKQLNMARERERKNNSLLHRAAQHHRSLLLSCEEHEAIGKIKFQSFVAHKHNRSEQNGFLLSSTTAYLSSPSRPHKSHNFHQ